MERQQEEPDADPIAAARAAGLRYVSDAAPGIRRRRAGKGFAYAGPDGAPLRDPEQLRRIRSLAIPPVWTDVWICPDPRGHIQATGRDAKGRKQYRYHARWRGVRDETKYDRLPAFGRALPVIRRRTEEDLERPGLPREKVLAAVVRLLEATLIRVGNQEYARRNRSFGLTTLRDRHVDVNGSSITFQYRGKAGKAYRTGLRDRRLARVVRRCQDLPGQELFQYVDGDGGRQTVESGDVNAYLREITGQDFTAKDFRTWAGTVLAFVALREAPPADSEAGARRAVVRAVESVAERLGNTPAVCRKAYVHPAVIQAYLEGALPDPACPAAESLPGLSAEEAAVLALLQERPGRVTAPSPTPTGTTR